MGQIEDLRIFVDIVNHGGIARAAEAANIAKSALSRRLKLLEDRYNVQLIDRRPGLWEVSAAGRELYQRAMTILDEMDGVEADFTHARQSIAGPLSLTVPREFGLEFLQPILLDFAARHPQIQLRVDFDDRRVDLERENYDLAIRIGGHDDPNLVATQLGTAPHHLYASPAYAARHGLPQKLEELANHPLLHYGAARRTSWEFETENGRQRIEFQPALNSNSGHFLLAAACAGQGITRLPDFITANIRQSGALMRVLPDIHISDQSIKLAYSKTRLLNRRMRLFIEEISSACLGPVDIP